MAFVTSSAAAIPGAGSAPPDHRAVGAQSLLSAKPPKQHYSAQGIALALYALLIAAALTTAFKPAQVVTEEEQAVEPEPAKEYRPVSPVWTVSRMISRSQQIEKEVADMAETMRLQQEVARRRLPHGWGKE